MLPLVRNWCIHSLKHKRPVWKPFARRTFPKIKALLIISLQFVLYLDGRGAYEFKKIDPSVEEFGS